MKSILLSALLMFSISVNAQKKDSMTKEKVYALSLTETEISGLWQLMEFSKANLPSSDAKSREVGNAVQSILYFQKLIATKYEEQQPKVAAPKK